MLTYHTVDLSLNDDGLPDTLTVTPVHNGVAGNAATFTIKEHCWNTRNVAHLNQLVDATRTVNRLLGDDGIAPTSALAPAAAPEESNTTTWMAILRQLTAYQASAPLVTSPQTAKYMIAATSAFAPDAILTLPPLSVWTCQPVDALFNDTDMSLAKVATPNYTPIAQFAEFLYHLWDHEQHPVVFTSLDGLAPAQQLAVVLTYIDPNATQVIINAAPTVPRTPNSLDRIPDGATVAVTGWAAQTVDLVAWAAAHAITFTSNLNAATWIIKAPDPTHPHGHEGPGIVTYPTAPNTPPITPATHPVSSGHDQNDPDDTPSLASAVMMREQLYRNVTLSTATRQPHPDQQAATQWALGVARGLLPAPDQLIVGVASMAAYPVGVALLWSTLLVTDTTQVVVFWATAISMGVLVNTPLHHAYQQYRHFKRWVAHRTSLTTHLSDIITTP